MNRTERKDSKDDTNRKIDEQTYFDKRVVRNRKALISYDAPFLQCLVRDLENYAISQLGDLKYKKLLLYGCGVNLKPAVEFVNRGATVYMIDISPRSIELVLKKVKDLNIGDRVIPEVMDCEYLKFTEGEFDAIYGRAILHHLGLEKAMSEIRRVLKEGGIGVFIEPLGMNPFINLYRRLTPKRRSPHEKPFNLQDLKFVESVGFSSFKHQEFTLFCCAGIFLSSFLKVREKASMIYNNLRRLDEFVLARFPFLRKLCWNTVLVMTK